MLAMFNFKGALTGQEPSIQNSNFYGGNFVLDRHLLESVYQIIYGTFVYFPDNTDGSHSQPKQRYLNPSCIHILCEGRGRGVERTPP